MPYLTPDAPPDDTVCFTLKIPNDVAWIGIVKGAISELIKSYNFEDFGDYSSADTALRFLQMYEEFAFSECDMGCCYDTVLHRTTTAGAMEISIDGGVTWTPDPEDPRSTVSTLPAPVPAGVSGTKCDAASNGKQHLEDMILGASTSLDTATTVIELVTDLLLLLLAALFLPEALPVLIPLLITTSVALFALGKTAFDAYWTTDEKDKILCALYCYISDDGDFNETTFAQVIARLTTDLTPSAAKDWFINEINVMGFRGLNNLCAYGSSADSDCSSCTCGSCVAGWTFIPNPTGGSAVIDGDALVCTTSDVNTDGKYYVLLEKDSGCHTGCGRNNSLQEIVSGGAGQQQAYISKENCNPDDWTFNINDTCIWRYLIKFNEPTVIRIFFEECAP